MVASDLASKAFLGSDMTNTARSRRVGISALAGGGARIVTMLCSFVSIPLCLKYLGNESFGVWATITSLVGVLAFADLGIGNGILNRIGAARGIGDSLAIRQAIASALCLLSAIAVAGFVIFSLCYKVVPWNSVLGITAELPSDKVALAILVFAALFAVNLPTTILQRVQYALQMGELNGIAQAAAGILSLALMYLIVTIDLGLAGMVAALMLAPILTIWGSAFWMFVRHPELRLETEDIQKKEMIAILKSGLQFLALGVSFALCFMTDNLIVAQVVGPESVASYAVHQKYLSPAIFFAGLILAPLWPAYAEALAAGDVQWVKRIFKRSVFSLGAMGGALTLGLIVVAPWLMRLWLAGRIVPDYLLLAALGLWVTIDLIGKAVAAFLNGVGLVKEQLWVVFAFLPVCIGMKIWFALLWGSMGVPLATALAYLIVHLPFYFFLLRRWYRNNNSGEAGHASGQ